MKLLIKAQVPVSADTVFAGFDRRLFEALAPGWLPNQIERFDGCSVGDEIHLRLPLGRWVSLITARETGAFESSFVDEGKVLPAPFVFWRHRHIVRSEKAGCCIIEDIEYKTKSPGLDKVMWPVLWLVFRARAPIYRRYFSEKK